MTRVLLTGASGQLGSRLQATLADAGCELACTTHADLDITAPDQVEKLVAELSPDVVVNAAAYTAVDRAETDEATAHLVNAVGPANLARALARRHGRLVHISTDYVFAGTSDRPHHPDDPTGPATAYGRTKLAGEQAIQAMLPDRSTILRTAWVWGGPGPNFVDTMCRLEQERPVVEVVADQVGSPTFVGDLAGAVTELVTRRDVAAPRLHFVNDGSASWYELARAVFVQRGADPSRVRPVSSDRMPRPAPRPRWSVLSTEAWIRHGFSPPRHWRFALSEALATPRTLLMSREG